MFIQERSISREEIERERETFLFKKYLSMRERERERERFIYVGRKYKISKK